MDGAADAGPLPDLKCCRTRHKSTGRAQSSGREPSVDPTDAPAVTNRLFFQKPNELAPGSVVHTLTETRPGHTDDRQVFDVDRLVLADQLKCCLVGMVTSSLSDLSMDDGYSSARFEPVGRTFDLARQRSLRLRELSLPSAKEPRVRDRPHGSIRGCDGGQRGQAEINPRLSRHRRQRRGLDAHDERRVVPAVRLPDQSYRGWHRRQVTGSDLSDLCVVEHHPRAPERPSQGSSLTGSRIHAIAVAG